MEAKTEEKKEALKYFFEISNSEENWKREAFITAMKEKFKIKYHRIPDFTLFLVDEDHYDEALLYSWEMAKKLQLTNSYWKNFYGERMLNGYFTIGMGYQEKGRTFDNSIDLCLWPYSQMPRDIKNYLERLNKCLGVTVSLHVRVNCIEFFVPDNLDRNKAIKKFKQFNELESKNSSMPFKKFKDTSLTGEIEDEYEKKERSLTSDGALSYFQNSAFYKCINNPDGHYYSQVEPDDNDLRDKIYTEGYHFWHWDFSKKFDISEAKPDSCGNGVFLIGSHGVEITLGDWKYYDSRLERLIHDKNVPIFNLEDKAKFFAEIYRDNTKIMVSVKSKINRYIRGFAFGNVVPYMIFTDKATVPLAPEDPQDYSTTIMINDTYEIVFDKYLLHKTSVSPCYEIYGLPDNFKIEDGIKDLPMLAMFEETEDLGLSSEDLVKRYLLAPKE